MSLRQDALMVDLETMSTEWNAAILSIGACMFDPFAGPEQPITEKFLVRVSPASNETFDRHFSGDTIEWWFRQDPEALASLFEHQTNLKNAMVQFRLWFQDETAQRPEEVWANDPDFDVTILKYAARAVHDAWPIFFANNRSVRTAGAMAYPDRNERKAIIKLFRSEIGTHHRADDDAVAQALFVAHCYDKLGITR